jgi:tetratricopeptide (TPR) repeat protein
LAEEQIMRGQLRAAEDRLLDALKSGRPGLNPVRATLERLARMQARSGDVTHWLRAQLREAEQPIALLRQLWLADRSAPRTAELRATLERALAQSPNDDRVWLGLGRVATLEGRFEEAAGWLKRCAAERTGDRAIDRAWLDWAYAARRADELARILATPVWNDFDRSEKLAWRARLAELQGQREDECRALERWLDAEPNNAAALERLGTLLAQGGDATGAADLRAR